MSWVRWGSECTFCQWPWYRWCHEGVDFCPGSSVYVYEGDGFVCCGCSMAPEHEQFTCATEAEMVDHLAKHAAAGDHVPRILYDPEVIARADVFWAALPESDRMRFVMTGWDIHEQIVAHKMAGWSEAVLRACRKRAGGD